ncbi:MAG: epoxyqueuosine reductase QueH [Candidatus Gastranaerophilales bacterium]|nr:epoxyqueuosine reductase QueH [Candidatus Gastranaerophilales bacterium]
MESKIVLLHTCCAPCCAYVAEKLQKLGCKVLLYFYNPNIFPLAEYNKRLDELKRFCKETELELILEDPDFTRWQELTKGLENELEKGKRCSICYRMRLEKTALKATELGINFFTTSLSISPHKSYPKIKEISLTLENDNLKFLDIDFKKQDGFKNSLELSKKYNFYRQSYCGCGYK